MAACLECREAEPPRDSIAIRRFRGVLASGGGGRASVGWYSDTRMAAVLFDATRLFIRAAHGAPTGIDRVTEAYGRWLMTRRDLRVIPVCAWGGYASPVSLKRFEAMLQHAETADTGSSGAWSALVEALSSPPSAPREALRPPPEAVARPAPRLLRYAPVAWRTASNWRPTSTPTGAVYLNVSHLGLEQPGLLERLGARGVRSVVMVHDLIPIAHPEYCSPRADYWHDRRMRAILGHASLIVANSQVTADDLAVFARGVGVSAPPICVAPLGLEPKFLRDPGDPPVQTPYFVCVGTIEPRKNLTFLLAIWRRLAERLGERTPPLVLAGRRGWENESVIDHLDRSPTARRLVHETGGLSDAELARLVGGATALLSPSFSEGFNLPVAEALALATPVIASDIPVHRELAKEATLIDPLDGPGWLAAIEAATLRRPPGRHREPMKWSDHFAIAAGAMKLGEA